MNLADYYFVSNLHNILGSGFIDETPRAKYEDGTTAHSISLTQVFEKYDLSASEFPITTLRPTAWKTAIQEILWIYQDQSNKLSDAHERGITWWDKFDVGDGTIGNRYGKIVADYGLISTLLYDLTTSPFSKRHVMSLWQVYSLESSNGLYPCAYETRWSVRKQGDKLFLDMTLHLQFVQTFKNPVRLAHYKKHVPQAHCEPVLVDNGVDKYCMKQETRVDGPWEYGEKPLQRNSRKDWEAVFLKAKQDILNTLDGGDTKDMNVISLFTTNHIELIEPTFLRGKRIGTIISMGSLDAQAAIDFIKASFAIGDYTINDDLTEVGELIAKYNIVPAFMAEIIEKVKANMILANQAEVKAEDIKFSVESYQHQMELSRTKDLSKSPAEELIEAIKKCFNPLDNNKVKEVIDQINEIHEQYE